jgi:antitoxin HigA-1
MKRKLTPLGEILDEEFLKPLAMTRESLAEHLGCDCEQIDRIVNGKERVNRELSMKLAVIFDTTADFWINAQMATDSR